MLSYAKLIAFLLWLYYLMGKCNIDIELPFRAKKAHFIFQVLNISWTYLIACHVSSLCVCVCVCVGYGQLHMRVCDLCVFVFFERFMITAAILVLCDFVCVCVCVCVLPISACIFYGFGHFGIYLCLRLCYIILTFNLFFLFLS